MASVKFPTFPSIDLSNLDMSKIDFSKIDFSKIDLSKINLPKIDAEAVTTVARDAAYVTVGLAVLAVQKAQVRRREISKSLNGQVGTSRTQIDDIVASVEARLNSIDSHIESIEGKLDSAVADLEKRLPERAGAMLGQAHDIAKAARQQVRGLIVSAA